ncbi:hypothetical protein [uncultured Methanobrevibacter sp.]|nr:hypothetical protein [uncultured Methanobrevibacter sp.]
MICDDCKYLIVRDKYKIVCKLNEHQLLDVKKCMNFEKIDEE